MKKSMFVAGLLSAIVSAPTLANEPSAMAGASTRELVRSMSAVEQIQPKIVTLTNTASVHRTIHRKPVRRTIIWQDRF